MIIIKDYFISGHDDTDGLTYGRMDSKLLYLKNCIMFPV